MIPVGKEEARKSFLFADDTGDCGGSTCELFYLPLALSKLAVFKIDMQK